MEVDISEIVILAIVFVTSFIFLYGFFHCHLYSARVIFWISFLTFFISGNIRVYKLSKEKIQPESSSFQYKITVNEKSFKTSGFKTKADGSIEFTADDGTMIRASDYEIRKLSGSNDISEGENK